MIKVSGSFINMTEQEIKKGIVDCCEHLSLSDIDIFEIHDKIVYYRVDGKEYYYERGSFDKK